MSLHGTKAGEVGITPPKAAKLVGIFCAGLDMKTVIS
jgi:hypothetical protein